MTGKRKKKLCGSKKSPEYFELRPLKISLFFRYTFLPVLRLSSFRLFLDVEGVEGGVCQILSLTQVCLPNFDRNDNENEGMCIHRREKQLSKLTTGSCPSSFLYFVCNLLLPRFCYLFESKVKVRGSKCEVSTNTSTT